MASAKKAGAQGMGYTLGTFLLPSANAIDRAKDSVDIYRDAFQPSSLNMDATVMVTVFIALADTEEEAKAAYQDALRKNKNVTIDGVVLTWHFPSKPRAVKENPPPSCS